MVSSSYTSDSRFSEWDEDEGFVVFAENDPFRVPGAAEVGVINAGKRQYRLICDYGTLVIMMKQEALKMGGNALRITRRQKRTDSNPCDRLEATAYWIPDISTWEEEIRWSENRTLDYADFKGRPDGRPNIEGATSSTMVLYTDLSGGSPVLRTHSLFFTRKSFIRPDVIHNEVVLNHEQRHFDIAEIHARILMKRLHESRVREWSEVQLVADRLIRKTQNDLRTMQESYDRDVYGGRQDAQNEWDDRVYRLLDELRPWYRTAFSPEG